MNANPSLLERITGFPAKPSHPELPPVSNTAQPLPSAARIDSDRPPISMPGNDQAVLVQKSPFTVAPPQPVPPTPKQRRCAATALDELQQELSLNGKILEELQNRLAPLMETDEAGFPVQPADANPGLKTPNTSAHVSTIDLCANQVRHRNAVLNFLLAHLEA